ncbi:MAG: type II secretion system F family protein [Acidimicrobiales bacterium]|nr:type II secretion system F family protein [Acidimicrobiales bacterium]
MRLRALSVASILLASVLVLAGPVAAQADDLVIESVDAASFPLVRAEVRGPAVEGDLDDAFVVSEDGEEVTADVVRLRSDDLNVVIAMDVSESMLGEPLERAKDAVVEMLDTLPEAVPVQLVSFGHTATVQTPFTTDRDATRAAVDGLIAAGGTALFDGITTSVSRLESQGGTSALVVLADGDDSTSDATINDARTSLAAQDITTRFVTLETESFVPETFDALAEASDGSVFSVDDAEGFGDALRQVGAGFGTSYEIRYRSQSSGETSDLQVALAADTSISATTEFAHEASGEFVPDLATGGRTVEDAGVFDSALVPILAAIFVSAGAVVFYFALRNSEGAIERREERREGRVAKKEERKRRVSGMQERLEGLSAQMLEANNRGRSLDDILDRAGLAVRSNEFVVAVSAVSIATLLVGVLLFGVPYFLLAGLLPLAGVPLGLKFLMARRRKTFVNQLGDTLQLMTGTLRAGYGLGQTLDSVSREAESPTSEEFARVVMETRLGRSLEDALDAMSYRIQAPDFDWVVDAIKIQASVGGDLSEIIEQVGDTIRARVRIKRQVDALTAEGKISALVLFCLPFGLLGFIMMSNPGYIEPMLSTGLGYVMLGAAGLMMLVGGLWLKKLVNPEF